MKNINKIIKIITLFFFGGGKVIEPIILDQGPKKQNKKIEEPRVKP